MPKLNHIVLFEFKSSATQEQIDTLMSELRKLTSIPCVVAISCGDTITTDRNKGYTHAMVVTIDSPENLSVYSNHEEHQRVLTNHIKPIIENNLAMDYVLQE
jgi:hypothetical protein